MTNCFRMGSDFQKEFPTRIKKFSFDFFRQMFFFRRKIEKLESITDWRRSSRRPKFFENFFLYRSQFWFRFFSFGFFFTKFLFSVKKLSEQVSPLVSFSAIFIFYFYLETEFLNRRLSSPGKGNDSTDCRSDNH